MKHLPTNWLKATWQWTVQNIQNMISQICYNDKDIWAASWQTQQSGMCP